MYWCDKRGVDLDQSLVYFLNLVSVLRNRPRWRLSDFLIYFQRLPTSCAHLLYPSSLYFSIPTTSDAEYSTHTILDSLEMKSVKKCENFFTFMLARKKGGEGLGHIFFVFAPPIIWTLLHPCILTTIFRTSPLDPLSKATCAWIPWAICQMASSAFTLAMERVAIKIGASLKMAT